MHYRNGRPAKNGDKVILLSGYTGFIGILYDGKVGPGGAWAGHLATITPNDPSAHIGDCLRLDDAKEALAAIAKFEAAQDIVTEHVQLEIIAASVIVAGQIITAWRANVAVIHARNANENAVSANRVSVVARAQQAEAIEQVHQAVNGGLAAAKAEIAKLKAELLVSKETRPPVIDAKEQQEERRDK